MHVLACGNRRSTIFHDHGDSRAYLDRLERYRHRDGVTLQSYILSPTMFTSCWKPATDSWRERCRRLSVPIASTTIAGTARPGMSSKQS